MVRLARFRLRFLLQEIDLPPGESILGRSASCHITIEDPLVSRRHARIQVTGDRATIEDLGSRNGLFVGGQLARGVVDVSAGARVRVGTQELVICRSAEEVPARGPAPVTGFMIHCGGCGFPYAAEHACCPHCGSSARNEDTTLSGSSKQAWSLDLVVDTLLRAKDLGRWSDLERVLRQARRVVEELLASSEPVDRGRLDELADAAVALSMEQGRAEWGRWILEVYATLGWLPPGEIGRSLGTLPPDQRVTLVPTVERIVQSAVRHVSPKPLPKSSSTRPPSTKPAQALPSPSLAAPSLAAPSLAAPSLSSEQRARAARGGSEPPAARRSEPSADDALEALRTLANVVPDEGEPPRGAGMAG